jgi:hypothetical protein
MKHARIVEDKVMTIKAGITCYKPASPNKLHGDTNELIYHVPLPAWPRPYNPGWHAHATPRISLLDLQPLTRLRSGQHSHSLVQGD